MYIYEKKGSSLTKFSMIEMSVKPRRDKNNKYKLEFFQ